MLSPFKFAGKYGLNHVGWRKISISLKIPLRGEGVLAFTRGVQILWTVQIAEDSGRKSSRFQFLFGDDLRVRLIEQRVNLVLTGTQGLLCDVGKAAAINRAQWLKSSVRACHGHGRVRRILGACNQVIDQGVRDERDVD